MKKKITALLLMLGMTITSLHAGVMIKAGALEEALEDTSGELTVGAVENTSRVIASTYAYGTELTHDPQFQNYEKIYGIDVSKWQGTIDWEKVKKAGIDFAILRIGNRTWGNGTISKDELFDEYMKGAHEAGIDLGVYFYTQAINVSEAKEEAEFVIDNLKQYPGYLTYPVYYDIEDIDKHRLGTAKLSNAQTTALCKTFCDTILKAGYDAGVYANFNEFNARLNKGELAGYTNWLARHAKVPTLSGTVTDTFFDGAYNMWQYSSGGRVSGINGNADMDVFYKRRLPGKTSGLKQTESSDSAIKVSWKQTEFADGYQIVCMDQDGNKVKTAKTSDPEYRLTKLTNGEVRQFKVRAYSKNSDGSYRYGEYSSVCEAYTLPEMVDGVEQTECDVSSVTIKWEKVQGAAGYRIRIYDPEKKTYQTHGTTIASSYKISDLELQESKQVVVDAYVKLNGTTKKYGKASDFCTIEAGPEQVKEVQVQALKSNEITLVWEAQQDISGYEVNVYDENEQLLFTENVEEPLYTGKKLKSATEYQFDVRSYLELEDGSRLYGDYSDMYCTTTIPAKVTGMEVIQTEKNSVTFTWKQQENISGYRVYLYDKNARKSKFIKATAKNSYTLKELNSSTNYYVKVKAYRKWNGTTYYGTASSILELKTK